MMEEDEGFFKTKKEDDNQFLIVLAVILVIAIIIIYCLSLGKINFIQSDDEKRKRLRWIDQRLKHLHVEAKNKEELKKELNRKVKNWFFIARCFLVLIYLGGNVIGYFYLTDHCLSFSDRVSCLLNYNELVLIGILVILFLVFESPSEFKDVFKLLHLMIQRMVYCGHHELDNEIVRINAEINALDEEKQNLIVDKSDDLPRLD